MAIPPLPTPLEQLGSRRFSFFPPIFGVEKNEWLFRRANWSELIVMNVGSSEELLIPRRFVGEVSSIEDPVLLVGLRKELEYRENAVWPMERRVIEMPIAVGAEPLPSRPRGPAAVVRITLHSSPRTRPIRVFIGAVVVLVFLILVVTGVLKLW